MLLSKLFEHLTYSELSTLAIGGYDDGEVPPEDYKKIIVNANLALIELYKRFPLSVREVVIQLRSNITEYQLHNN